MIMNAYALTEDKGDIFIDWFCYKLEQVYDSIPAVDIRVMGNLVHRSERRNCIRTQLGLTVCIT
jgi:hypothetical protein